MLRTSLDVKEHERLKNDRVADAFHEEIDRGRRTIDLEGISFESMKHQSEQTAAPAAALYTPRFPLLRNADTKEKEKEKEKENAKFADLLDVKYAEAFVKGFWDADAVLRHKKAFYALDKSRTGNLNSNDLSLEVKRMEAAGIQVDVIAAFQRFIEVADRNKDAVITWKEYLIAKALFQHQALVHDSEAKEDSIRQDKTLSEEKLLEIRRDFEKLDPKGLSFVSREDYLRYIRNKYSETCSTLFRADEVNKDYSPVTYEQFLGRVVKYENRESEAEYVRKSAIFLQDFSNLDKDHSGTLSLEELQQAMRRRRASADDEAIDAAVMNLMTMLDTNCTGYVSQKEYVNGMIALEEADKVAKEEKEQNERKRVQCERIKKNEELKETMKAKMACNEKANNTAQSCCILL